MARQTDERRSNAIAFALAMHSPKDIDKALPAAPSDDATPRPEKQEFVETEWWER